MPGFLISGFLNLLEPSGPAQACDGVDLPLTFTLYGTIRVVLARTVQSDNEYSNYIYIYIYIYIVVKIYKCNFTDSIPLC
jgi:hypothetical protein